MKTSKIIQGESSQLKTPRVMACSALTGNAVTNIDGEDLGRVEHIMLDMESGRIAYAVISTGGMLARNRMYAMPWDVLRLSLHDKKYLVNMRKADFERAPHYDRDSQPDTSDIRWLNEVYTFYGQKPYWQE